jgi:hypothetical protein
MFSGLQHLISPPECAHVQTTPTLAINFTAYEMSKAFMMRLLRADEPRLMPGGAPVPPPVPPASPCFVQDPVPTDVVAADVDNPQKGSQASAYSSAAQTRPNTSPAGLRVGGTQLPEQPPEGSAATASSLGDAAATNATAAPVGRGRATDSATDVSCASNSAQNLSLAPNESCSTSAQGHDSARGRLIGNVGDPSVACSSPSGSSMHGRVEKDGLSHEVAAHDAKGAATVNGYWDSLDGHIEPKTKEMDSWELQRHQQLPRSVDVKAVGRTWNSLPWMPGQHPASQGGITRGGVPTDIVLQLQGGLGQGGMPAANDVSEQAQLHQQGRREVVGRGEVYLEPTAAPSGANAKGTTLPAGPSTGSTYCERQADTQGTMPLAMSTPEAFKQRGVGSKAIISLVAGSASGVVSSTVTFPLDVVRRNLQVTDGLDKETYREV